MEYKTNEQRGKDIAVDIPYISVFHWVTFLVSCQASLDLLKNHYLQHLNELLSIIDLEIAVRNDNI
jgi:hypothetical protein